MALQKCPECGGQVSTTAWMCPHCGARPQTNRWLLAVAMGVAPLVAVILLFIVARAHH